VEFGAGFFLYKFHPKVLKEFLFFAFCDCQTRDLSHIEFKMLLLTQILAINTVPKHSIIFLPCFESFTHTKSIPALLFILSSHVREFFTCGESFFQLHSNTLSILSLFLLFFSLLISCLLPQSTEIGANHHPKLPLVSHPRHKHLKIGNPQPQTAIGKSPTPQTPQDR
jgi:hypothetical protein